MSIYISPGNMHTVDDITPLFMVSFAMAADVFQYCFIINFNHSKFQSAYS